MDVAPIVSRIWLFSADNLKDLLTLDSQIRHLPSCLCYLCISYADKQSIESQRNTGKAVNVQIFSQSPQSNTEPVLTSECVYISVGTEGKLQARLQMRGLVLTK